MPMTRDDRRVIDDDNDVTSFDRRHRKIRNVLQVVAEAVPLNGRPLAIALVRQKIKALQNLL